MTLQEFESTMVWLRGDVLLQKKVTIQRNYFHTLCKSIPGLLKILKIYDKERPVKTILGGPLTRHYAREFEMQSQS